MEFKGHISDVTGGRGVAYRSRYAVAALGKVVRTKRDLFPRGKWPGSGDRGTCWPCSQGKGNEIGTTSNSVSEQLASG